MSERATDSQSSLIHVFNINFSHLTGASIKAVADKLQLPDKSHSCRELNDMEQMLVLQTPHMKKTRPENASNYSLLLLLLLLLY